MVLSKIIPCIAFPLLFLWEISICAQNADSVQAFKYFELFDKYEFQDSSLAKRYVDSSLYFAKASEQEELIAKAYLFKGWHYQDFGAFEEAKEAFVNSLFYHEKAGSKQGIANAHGNLGNAFLDLDNYQESLEHQLRSLDINEEILLQHDLDSSDIEEAIMGKSYALHNIGAIYGEIGLHEKGMEYAWRSYAFEKQLKNYSGIAISLSSLARAHKHLDHPDSAAYYYREAIKVHKSGNLDDRFSYASVLYSFSLLKSDELTEEEKTAMFYESLQIRREIGEKEGELRMLLTAAGKGDKISSDSLNHLIDLVEAIINDNGFLNLEENYQRVIARYYARNNQFEKAFLAYDRYFELRNISDEKIKSHNLIAGDIKHQLERKHFNDSLQIESSFELERVEQLQKIQRIKYVVYIIIVGCVILAISLFFIISANRKRKKLNKMLADKNDLIEEKNKEILDSISYAKRLQRAILPNTEVFNQYLPDSFLFFKPKDIVSGDFYWFEVVDDLNMVAVADCTGHGVPGAMVSVVCSNALSRCVNEFGLKEPDQILNKTRELVISTFGKSGENVTDGMDISLVTIDKKEQLVKFSGANNSLWVVRSNQLLDDRETVNLASEQYSLIEFKGDKQPIGLYHQMSDFSLNEFNYIKGDVIYLSSDGYPDQFGGIKQKKFKYKTLKKALLSIQSLSLEQQKLRLEAQFEDWKGDFEQTDDVCLMGIIL